MNVASENRVLRPVDRGAFPAGNNDEQKDMTYSLKDLTEGGSNEEIGKSDSLSHEKSVNKEVLFHGV